MSSSNTAHNELRILNRTVRRTSEGFELEGDQRHAEIVIEQLELHDAKLCQTPGADSLEDKGEEQELDIDNARKF